MLYRIDGSNIEAVEETTSIEAGLYEKDIEDWIESRPEMLGEDLLIIGRQVTIESGKDRIDLLAIDRQGSLVIIELKRDLIGGDADLQALRYAALVSAWSYEQVQTQAEGYWATTGSDRGTLAQELEKFCDEGYDVNGLQRLILAGREVKPRLGSTALWLRAQGLDVTVSTIQLFQEEGFTYVQPQVVIPPPSEDRYAPSVSVGSSDKPWLRNGEQWHLEQRASEHGRKTIDAVVDLVAGAVPDTNGPFWNQKFYISWKDQSNRIWATLGTGSPNVEYLTVRNCPFSAEDAAGALSWELFDVEANLSEKFAQGSSVKPEEDGSLRFGIKAGEDVSGQARPILESLLQQAWNHASTPGGTARQSVLTQAPTGSGLGGPDSAS